MLENTLKEERERENYKPPNSRQIIFGEETKHLRA